MWWKLLNKKWGSPCSFSIYFEKTSVTLEIFNDFQWSPMCASSREFRIVRSRACVMQNKGITLNINTQDADNETTHQQLEHYISLTNDTCLIFQDIWRHSHGINVPFCCLRSNVQTTTVLGRKNWAIFRYYNNMSIIIEELKT